MYRLNLVIGMLFTGFVVSAAGQTPESEYISIYQTIQQAEMVRGEGNQQRATELFESAAEELRELQTTHPTWNPGVVKFRLEYASRALEEIRLGGEAPSQNEGRQELPQPDREPFVDQLREEVDRLQADKAQLEARLSEALKVQPAAADPRELAKAEEEIQELMRLNRELQGKLDEEQEAVQESNESDSRQLSRVKVLLKEREDALKVLSIEKQVLQSRVDNLREENEALQKRRWQSLLPEETPRVDLRQSDQLEDATEMLARTNEKIREQAMAIVDLNSSIETLEQRMGVLTDENTRLARDNQSLITEINSLRNQLENGTDLSEWRWKLEAAQQEIALLKQANERLQQEKEVLETRIAELETLPGDESESQRTKRLREEIAGLKTQMAEIEEETVRKEREVIAAQQRLEVAEEQVEDLRLENQTLELTMTSLEESTQIEVRSLELENTLLKDQLQRSESGDIHRRLQRARQDVAVRELANEMLRIERNDLRRQMRDLERRQPSSPTNIVQPDGIPEPKDELDNEKKGRLHGIWKRLRRGTNVRTGQAGSSPLDFQKRMAVNAASQGRYTMLELADFQRVTTAADAPTSATGNAKDLQRVTGRNSLPAGASRMVTQAETCLFGRRSSLEREELYLQVLKLDDSNPYTLANIAAVRIEQGRLDEAETELKKALEVAPDDAFSLWLTGILKFKRDDFQGALEVLKRAAELDPTNGQTQNYLGITYSKLGDRKQAESALRKALKLSPKNQDVHHNLATIYLQQDPPFVELARWHYEQSLINGHARNSALERLLNQAQE